MTLDHAGPGRPCAIADALAVVGDRWSLLIVREIALGNRRFSQIARNTGAPRDRLSLRLKDLVASGVVERREYRTHPQYFEYELTAAGNDLVPVLHVLRDWGERWVMGFAPMEFEHHDHTFTPVVVCGECGDRVCENDVRRHSTVTGWDVHGPLSAKQTTRSRAAGAQTAARAAGAQTAARAPRSDGHLR